MTTERPTTLLAELTHRCPLHCPYCSNPLDLLRAESEIGTDDWKRVFTEARELGVLQLGLSGGEPLVRKDLEALAAHARSLGLYTTLVTSGLGLTRKRAEALRAAGLEHVQVSVQDADPESAERIAACSSVKQKQAAIALVKELGFAFTINVVLHRANLDRIGEIIDLAAGCGADRLELANTQYYGWGLKNRGALMPTPGAGARGQGDRRRTRMQRYKGQMQILFVLPDYFEELPKACYGGWGRYYIVVSPDGKALPCHGAYAIPSLDLPSVREHSLRLDLARVARVPGLPRRRVDEGALPELPPEGGGLRRLPLPGARAHRRRGQRRSGLHAEPAPASDRRGAARARRRRRVRLPRLRRRAPARVSAIAPAILSRGLGRDYGGVRALDALTLDVPAGALVGLLGPERRGQDDGDAAPGHAPGSHRGERPHLRP